MARHSKEAKDSTKPLHAFYVYCIGEQDGLAPLFEGLLPETIEPESEIDLVVAGRLGAVVSAVPLKDYNEEALQAKLSDPTWTAIRAMRHERVVEYFASRASIIPLRFGTIYLRRDPIEQMLSSGGEQLRAMIARLRDRQEWGVILYRNRAKLLDAVRSLSPRLRELGERATPASPGQSYLLQKKIDAMRLDEARAETKRVISEIERELAASSDGAARLRVMKDEASEHGETVAKFAFLVEKSRFDEFRAAAERLAEKHTASGFQLEMTGPWPAYNFASTG